MPFEKGNRGGVNPPKAPVKKKGKATWRPEKMLDVRDKNPGYRYRWMRDDDARLAKVEAEGWVKVNRDTGVSGEHKATSNVSDGAPLTTGLNTYREHVLYALDEDLGKARDEWVNRRTKQQTAALQSMDHDIKRKVGKSAGVYGEIRIKGE